MLKIHTSALRLVQLFVVVVACGIGGMILQQQLSQHSDTECVRLGDFTVIELEVLDASHGRQLLGPYSRFRFHHPGPLSAYLYSLPTLLLGPEWLHIRAFELVQIWTQILLLLAVVGVSIYAPLGWRGGATLLCAAMILGPRLHPFVFSDIWGPSRVVIPLALTLPMLALVAVGAWWAMPVAVLSASLVLANHITTVPTLFLSIVCTVGMLVWRRRTVQLRAMRWPLLISALMSFLIWLPPIVEALSNRGGNLARILKQTDQASASMPFTEAISAMAVWNTGRPQAWEALSMTAILLLLPLIAPLRVRLLARTWSVLNIAAVLGFVWSTMHIRGKAYDYLFWPQWGVAMSVAALAAWVAWEWMRGAGTLRSRLSDGVVLGGIAMASAIAIQGTTGRPCESIDWLKGAQQVIAHTPQSERIVFSAQSYGDWDKPGILLTEALRKGYVACIDPRFKFIYGTHSCSAQGGVPKHSAADRPATLITFVRQPPTECGGAVHPLNANRSLLVQALGNLKEQVGCIKEAKSTTKNRETARRRHRPPSQE